MAERTALIDMRSPASLDGSSVYIFRDGREGFELESSFELTAGELAAGGADARIDGSMSGEFHLSLPLEALSFRVLKFSFSGREKLSKVIPFELDSLIIGGREGIVFDFIALGPKEKPDVLVAYMEKDRLRDILLKLSSFNIDPKTVTSIELAAALRGAPADIAGALLGASVMDESVRLSCAKEEISSPTVNLRRGVLAYTKDAESAERRLNLTAALLAMLALVIIGGLAMRAVSAKKGSAALKKEIRGAYSALFPDDKKISDELYQMKSHLKEMRERGDAMAGASPLQILLSLAERKTDGVMLSEVTADNGTITIKGEAADSGSIDAMRLRLGEFLREVTIADVKPSADGRSVFTAIGKAAR